MRYVCVVQPGDEVTIVQVADAAPSLVPDDEFEAWAKYENAARAMRELGLEPPPFKPDPGITGMASVRPVIIDDEPIVFLDGPNDGVFRSKDVGQRVCVCGRAYMLNGDPAHDADVKAFYAKHIARCEVAAGHKHLGGNAEPGEYVWGSGDESQPMPGKYG